jgi:hypothetical protein
MNQIPPNPMFWSEFAMKGSAGIQGPKGDIGPKGDKGDAGNVDLSSMCAAIIAANKLLPTFCTSAALTSIAVSPINQEIFEGGTTLQFNASGTFSDTSTQDLTTSLSWNSSNQSVATINKMALLLLALLERP